MGVEGECLFFRIPTFNLCSILRDEAIIATNDQPLELVDGFNPSEKY